MAKQSAAKPFSKKLPPVQAAAIKSKVGAYRALDKDDGKGAPIGGQKNVSGYSKEQQLAKGKGSDKKK